MASSSRPVADERHAQVGARPHVAGPRGEVLAQRGDRLGPLLRVEKRRAQQTLRLGVARRNGQDRPGLGGHLVPLPVGSPNPRQHQPRGEHVEERRVEPAHRLPDARGGDEGLELFGRLGEPLRPR